MAYDSRTSLLNTSVDDLPDGPPVLNAGHYYGQVLSYSQGPVPWNAEQECVFYTCQLTEPGPDIDPESVDGIDLRSLRMRDVVYPVTPDRIGELKRFLKSCNPGKPMPLHLDSAIPEPVGRRVLATVTRTADKKGSNREYNNIVAMMATEDD